MSVLSVIKRRVESGDFTVSEAIKAAVVNAWAAENVGRVKTSRGWVGTAFKLKTGPRGGGPRIACFKREHTGLDGPRSIGWFAWANSFEKV